MTARQAAAAPRSIDPRQCRTGFGWPKDAEGRGSERHGDMTNVSGVVHQESADGAPPWRRRASDIV